MIRRYTFVLLGLSFLLTSCSTTRFLSDDESLVKNIEFEVKDSGEPFNKSNIKSKLNYFVPQQKNTKFLFFIPREYFYFINSQPDDTTKVNEWGRNSVGETPAIFDEDKTRTAALEMEKFLRYKKGWYDAEVTFEERTSSKKTFVTYIVDPKKRYYLGNINYVTQDSSILQILNEIKPDSYIKKGDPADGEVFDLEINRISTSIQNRGYADFNTKYIDIKGDSTVGNRQIDIFLEIFTPPEKPYHQQYRVGDVKVYTDYYSKQDTFFLIRQKVNGKNYFREASEFVVKPNELDELILLQPGDLTKRNPRLKTQRNLSNLSAYRFANVKPYVNPNDSTLLNYDILLQNYNNKYIWDYGVDVFNSLLAQGISSPDPALSRVSVGFSLSGSITNRNTFGGSELNTTSAEIGAQFGLTNPVTVRTFNGSLQNNLQLPTLKDPVGYLRFLRSLGIIEESKSSSLNFDGSTNIDFGLSYIDILNNYRIGSINATFGYQFQYGQEKNLRVNNFGIIFNNYDLKPEFLNNIGNNPLLLNTFKDNLITGLFLQNISYTYTGKTNSKGRSFNLLTTFENSGVEIWGVNQISNAISGATTDWTPNNNVQFAKYLRGEIDTSVKQSFGRAGSLSGRFSAGIIIPFADNATSPYIRQFSVGGPNSVRAWFPRELGPGTSPVLNANTVVPFKQGDIKLEANLEYRFSMGWIFEGALFFDTGNIWNLKNGTTTGVDERISTNFYNQLAFGTGYGIRMNFDFFVLRFDFGYKLKDPGQNWRTLRNITGQGIGNFQFAIGYPF